MSTKFLNARDFSEIFLRLISCLRKPALIRQGIIIGLAFALLGCPYHIWEPVSSEVQFPSFRIAIHVPSGWHRFYDGTDDLLISHDGLTLQNIRIRDVSFEEKKAGEGPMVSSSMSPQDLVEWVLNSSPGDVQLENRQILESVSSTLGGNSGTKILLSGETPKGLRYKQLHYVYFLNSRVHVFSFTAVARHYFERDEPVFEKIRMSFQSTKKAEA